MNILVLMKIIESLTLLFDLVSKIHLLHNIFLFFKKNVKLKNSPTCKIYAKIILVKVPFLFPFPFPAGKVNGSRVKHISLLYPKCLGVASVCEL